MPCDQVEPRKLSILRPASYEAPVSCAGWAGAQPDTREAPLTRMAAWHPAHPHCRHTLICMYSTYCTCQTVAAVAAVATAAGGDGGGSAAPSTIHTPTWQRTIPSRCRRRRPWPPSQYPPPFRRPQACCWPRSALASLSSLHKHSIYRLHPVSPRHAATFFATQPASVAQPVSTPPSNLQTSFSTQSLAHHGYTASLLGWIPTR